MSLLAKCTKPFPEDVQFDWKLFTANRLKWVCFLQNNGPFVVVMVDLQIHLSTSYWNLHISIWIPLNNVCMERNIMHNLHTPMIWDFILYISVINWQSKFVCLFSWIIAVFKNGSVILQKWSNKLTLFLCKLVYQC